MSYLLDRKAKRDKLFKTIFIAVILLGLIYFRSFILRELSSFSHSIFRPAIILGNNIGDNISNASSFFRSKKILQKENEDLKNKISESEAIVANHNTILDENLKLKEILGRKNEGSNMILGAILSKPNRSPYDVILVDIGEDKGLAGGERVFGYGNVPIGKVAEVYKRSAKVVLYSTPGEKIEVVIAGSDLFMQLVGRGGGNFEMILPRDFSLDKGTEVHLPGITPYTVAIVRSIVSDPRDSFLKALLVSPVNIQDLKFVQIEK